MILTASSGPSLATTCRRRRSSASSRTRLRASSSDGSAGDAGARRRRGAGRRARGVAGAVRSLDHRRGRYDARHWRTGVAAHRTRAAP
jgi:hypothetical protein